MSANADKTDNEKEKQKTIFGEVPEALEEKLAELKILQESLNEAKAKAQSYYDQLVRSAADFDNFRKRSEQRIEQARLQGKEEVLEKILTLSDALQQAQNSLTPQSLPNVILEGLKLLGKEMDKTLQGAGIEPIRTDHQKFDPHLHEAVERVPSAEPEGTILGEVQRGYMFDGHVLRHARVRVAAPKTHG